MRIRSSKSSPTHSRTSSLGRLVLLLFAAAAAAAGETRQLEPVATGGGAHVVRRWALPGHPHGIAVGADGTIYAGLAQPQAVIALDPRTGAIRKRIVLDSADIASTKELVTLRTDAAGTRLYIANGSDESASILEIPRLNVRREITIEGEPIRDALPDPGGRYLYLLGRRVHVYDIDGEQELRTIPLSEPMAIAATPTSLFVVGESNERGQRRTVLVRYDAKTFAEKQRVGSPAGSPAPRIEAIVVTAPDAITAFSRDTAWQMKLASAQSAGSVVASPLCLPASAGPQSALLLPDRRILLAQTPCDRPAVLLPKSFASIEAGGTRAMAFDRRSGTAVATDSAGYLTIYKAPAAAAPR